MQREAKIKTNKGKSTERNSFKTNSCARMCWALLCVNTPEMNEESSKNYGFLLFAELLIYLTKRAPLFCRVYAPQIVDLIILLGKL